MKGYKGFHKGLICEGYNGNIHYKKQYAENTIFEEENAAVCNSGMHFCLNPLDVLDYYPLINGDGELNEFAEVEALDEVHTDDNKKYCTKKLKVGAKLDIVGFAKASFDFLKETITSEAMKDVQQVGGDYVQQVGGYDAKQVGGNDAKQQSGKHSIMVSENNSKAKGGIGSIIVMVERNSDREIVTYKAVQIDGENYKPDTWYTMKNGEMVEVEENR